MTLSYITNIYGVCISVKQFFYVYYNVEYKKIISNKNDDDDDDDLFHTKFYTLKIETHPILKKYFVKLHGFVYIGKPIGKIDVDQILETSTCPGDEEKQKEPPVSVVEYFINNAQEILKIIQDFKVQGLTFKKHRIYDVANDCSCCS